MTMLNNILFFNSLNAFVSIFFIILFIILTAYISASEIAYFSLSPSKLKKIKENKSKTNNLILRQLNDPERLLATILIANTFFNISIVVFSTYLSTCLKISLNHPFSIFSQVIILTLLILFFGEILPKTYSTQNDLSVLKKVAFPVLFLEKLFYPLSSLLILSSSYIKKHFSTDRHNISYGDLQRAVELVSVQLEDDERILKGIIKFRNIDVKEIMKYRNLVFVVDIKDSFCKILEIINQKGYSRIPVISERFDNMSGILYIKDLLPHIHKSDTFKWQSLIRPAYFVPETKKINDLLKEFQTNKNHIAIVVDEYGGSCGIVTLEDILEEIVGDINDGDITTDIRYIKTDDENFIFDGTTLLNDFYKIINVEDSIFEKIKGDADTLAGLILEMKGFIPQKDEIIKFQNLIFKIISVDNRRIKRVQVTFKPNKENGTIN
jgi:putative hemolysin